MSKCILCDNEARLQSYYCTECSQICRVDDCGKPSAWPNAAICMEHNAEEHNELDAAMDWIDDACWAGEWKEINEKLQELNVNKMRGYLIVCWLTMTKCVEKHLPYRAEFSKKAYARFVDLRGRETAERILKGIE